MMLGLQELMKSKILDNLISIVQVFPSWFVPPQEPLLSPAAASSIW